MLNDISTMENAKNSKPEDEDDNDSEATGSSDECLLDMLGLTTIGSLSIENNEIPRNDDDLTKESVVGETGSDNKNLGIFPSYSKSSLDSLIKSYQLNLIYEQEGMCIFPSEFSIPAKYMRQLTEELVWGSANRVQADRTYETIKIYKNGEIEHRRTLTRLENFVVDANEGWNGRKFNTGKLVPNGVYVVTVSYVNYEDEVTNLQGMVTVLR